MKQSGKDLIKWIKWKLFGLPKEREARWKEGAEKTIGTGIWVVGTVSSMHMQKY